LQFNSRLNIIRFIWAEAIMKRTYLFSVFSAAKCFFLLLACIGYAHAEMQPVGPVDVTVRVDDVDIPLVLKGALDVNTAKGDFNVNGKITVSSATSKLRDGVIGISAKFFPFSIPLPICALSITRISSFDISSTSKDGEAVIDVGLHLAQDCFGHRESEGKVKLAVIPKVLKGNRLSWNVPRDPELDLRGLAHLLRKEQARKIIQDFLDKHGTIQIPAVDGVRSSLQGAAFEGDKDTLSFRINADAHTDGAKLTSLLAQYLKTQNFNFTIPKLQ
jgi:hypothetical protein